MNAELVGATRLLTALHEAGQAFGSYGYRLYRAHPSVSWSRTGRVGSAAAPCASLGVCFELRDEQKRELCVGLDVWVRDGGFEITGDVTIDDDIPEEAQGNQRFLVDLPLVRTTDLGECVEVIHRYTSDLCSRDYLDELGIPRVDHGTGPYWPAK